MGIFFFSENLYFALIYNDLWESVLFISFVPAYLIICMHVFCLLSSVRIFMIYVCVNLCFCDNKQVYEYHHLKQIFYHQKQIMIFCWFHMFQVCVFFFEFFLFCVSTFLLNKVSLNSLNSVAIFTPFAVLDSLPLSESI